MIYFGYLEVEVLDVFFRKKSGHKFFQFVENGVFREICVDGWMNRSICPDFCDPSLHDGFVSLYDDHHLDVTDFDTSFVLRLPTCFGFVSRSGHYRNCGNFHMVLSLEKTGLYQFLYNFIV